MKTTIELPDDLLMAARRKALETNATLREVVERALRRELRPENGRDKGARPRRVRFVTGGKGLPPGLDLSSREKMWDWFDRNSYRSPC